MSLFRRKSIAALQAEAAGDHGLRRALGPVNLVMLGIGAIIGTGIFVLTGTVAANNAGPAVIISFALAGLASVFAALCYAEFASMVPISGSAYTYAYASLGELVAWIIGWDLIVEYAVGNIGVAIGWSGYFRELLTHFGLALPAWLATDVRSAHMAAEAVETHDAWVAAGYYRRDADGERLRPTWTGAVRVTWRLLWPVKPLFRARRRRATRELLARHGITVEG